MGAVDHGEQRSCTALAFVHLLLVLLYFVFVSNCSKLCPKPTSINISTLHFKASQKRNMCVQVDECHADYVIHAV